MSLDFITSYTLGFVWCFLYRRPGYVLASLLLVHILWFTLAQPEAMNASDTYVWHVLCYSLGVAISVLLYQVFTMSQFIVYNDSLEPLRKPVLAAIGVAFTAVALLWNRFDSLWTWAFLVAASAYSLLIFVSFFVIRYDELPYMSDRRLSVHFWWFIGMLFTVCFYGTAIRLSADVWTFVWILVISGATGTFLVAFTALVFVYFSSNSEPSRFPLHENDDEGVDNDDEDGISMRPLSAMPDELRRRITDNDILRFVSSSSQRRSASSHQHAPPSAMAAAQGFGSVRSSEVD